MRSLAKAALSAIGLASLANAYTTHTVIVGGTDENGKPMLKYTPPYVNTKDGDHVQFTFHVKNHTVTQSSFADPCTPLADAMGDHTGFDSGFMAVPDMSTSFPTFEIVISNSSAPTWAYCRQRADPNPTHCQQGMVWAANPGSDTKFNQFLVNAKDSVTQNWNATGNTTTMSHESAMAMNTTTNSTSTSTSSGSHTTHTVIVGGTLPDGKPDLTFKPNDLNASVGDYVMFKFMVKNHTATQSSFNSPCAKLVSPYGVPTGFDSYFMAVPPNASNITNFTFPEFTIQVMDENPIWGYCRQRNDPNPTHCQSGMVFGINSAGKFDQFLTNAKASTTQNLPGAQAASAYNTTKTMDHEVSSASGSSYNGTTTASAAAVTHTVLVGGTKPDGTPDLSFKPNNFNASIGDYLEFHFNVKNHTVTQSPFGTPCAKLTDAYGNLNGFDSGFMPFNGSGYQPVFTVRVNDTAPIWGYCRQFASPNRTHCQADMVFGVNTPLQGNTFGKYQVLAETSTDQGVFTGTDGNLTFVNTSAPTAAEPARPQKTHNVIVGGLKADGVTADLAFAPNNLNASVGDVVKFIYLSKNHTVTRSSFANPCAPDTADTNFFDSGFLPSDAALTTALLTTATNYTSFGTAPNATLLADVAQLPSFTITVNDTNPIWGYCKQISPPATAGAVGVPHCRAGMVFGINVGSPDRFTQFLASALNTSSSTNYTSANSTKGLAAVEDASGDNNKKSGVPTAVWALVGTAAGLGLLLAAFGFYTYRKRKASQHAYATTGGMPAPVMSKKQGYSIFGQKYSKLSGKDDASTVFDHDEFDSRDGPELKPYGDGGAAGGNYRDMPEAPPMPQFKDDAGDALMSTTPRGSPRGKYDEPQYHGDA